MRNKKLKIKLFDNFSRMMGFNDSLHGNITNINIFIGKTKIKPSKDDKALSLSVLGIGTLILCINLYLLKKLNYEKHNKSL